MSGSGANKALTWMILGLTLLISCVNGQNALNHPPSSQEQPSRAELLPTSGDIYEVKAWVDKPAPRQDEQVTVYGSLIKNGVYLGGIMMQARWSKKALTTGIPDCFVLVIYGTGVCVVAARDFLPGRYVPITILFDYEGQVFTGKTGFTPIGVQ